jgi:hypothetical protein
MGDGMIWAAILLLLALLPASIARAKGRYFFGWYLFGLALWIVAFPASIFVSDRRPRCPRCAEVIQPSAVICPHCRSSIS